MAVNLVAVSLDQPQQFRLIGAVLSPDTGHWQSVVLAEKPVRIWTKEPADYVRIKTDSLQPKTKFSSHHVVLTARTDWNQIRNHLITELSWRTSCCRCSCFSYCCCSRFVSLFVPLWCFALAAGRLCRQVLGWLIINNEISINRHISDVSCDIAQADGELVQWHTNPFLGLANRIPTTAAL